MLLEVGHSEIMEEIAVVGAKPIVIVGIPAFNEEAMIERVVFEAKKYADVVVVCDDGSNDTTGAIAKRSGADVVHHRRNFGYGASIKSLFKRACELNADVLVTLDADGQHNPDEIPTVVKPILKGAADIVIGSRFIAACDAEEMPFYRRLGAQLITKMVNGSSKSGITDAQSGFRAYNRFALERLSPIENGMGASVEILLNASRHDLKIGEVPTSCKYRVGVETSTKNPVIHGLSVIMSIVRFMGKGKLLPIVHFLIFLEKKIT